MAIAKELDPTDPTPWFYDAIRKQSVNQPVEALRDLQRSIGDELVLSGVWGRVSYSLGQFYHKTDGFRANNDLRQDICNAFAQRNLSCNTSVHTELRRRDFKRGD